MMTGHEKREEKKMRAEREDNENKMSEDEERKMER